MTSKPRGTLTGVTIPDAYAIQVTFRGDEVRFFAHAAALLGAAGLVLDGGWTPLTNVLCATLNDFPGRLPAATSALNKMNAVWDVLQAVEDELNPQPKESA